MEGKDEDTSEKKKFKRSTECEGGDVFSIRWKGSTPKRKGEWERLRQGGQRAGPQLGEKRFDPTLSESKRISSITVIKGGKQKEVTRKGNWGDIQSEWFKKIIAAQYRMNGWSGQRELGDHGQGGVKRKEMNKDKTFPSRSDSGEERGSTNMGD